MGQTPAVSSVSLPENAGRWIGRVIVAVLVAEGIWGLLTSLTRNVIVPALARTMGGDAQSPLYLGKGDFNFPALFISILELCLAGIVAVALNYWLGRGPRTAVPRIATARRATAKPVSPPPAAKPTQTAVPPPPAEFWSPPAPKPETAKVPTKSAKPQEVYYNIVGEPINPTEND